MIAVTCETTFETSKLGWSPFMNDTVLGVYHVWDTPAKTPVCMYHPKISCGKNPHKISLNPPNHVLQRGLLEHYSIDTWFHLILHDFTSYKPSCGSGNSQLAILVPPSEQCSRPYTDSDDLQERGCWTQMIIVPMKIHSMIIHDHPWSISTQNVI